MPRRIDDSQRVDFASRRQKDSRIGARERKKIDEEDDFSWKTTVRDIVVGILVMLLLLASVYVYTGNWPPIVVVISPSMVHGEEESHIGVIDIGDIVMVKKVESRSDLQTWVQGKADGYSTYGNYGNVVVYKKNGGEETPVIHRLLVWVDVYHRDPNNRYNISFNITELGLYNVTSFVIHDYPFWNPDGSSYKRDLKVDLNVTIKNFEALGVEPHGGYLTKGDYNQNIDQVALRAATSIGTFSLVEPVKLQWIVGRAVGELPWMGLIKLTITGDMDGTPARNSWVMLIFSVIFILLLPVFVEFSVNLIQNIINRRKGSVNKDTGDQNDDRKGYNKRNRGPGPSERNGPRR